MKNFLIFSHVRVALIGAIVFVATTVARAQNESRSNTQIDPSVVQTADALGKAFRMVAKKVQPSVVSVYSERIVSLKEPEFGFPFGDEFFRRFFGQDLPRQQNPGRSSPDGRSRGIPQRGMGSGMVLNKDGYILTNFHVVRDVDDVKVQLPDGRRFEAEVVGTDAKTDVAVIRIKGDVPEDLVPVTLGDSDTAQVGDLVIAIGAPFGLTQTVTEGIVSATGRSDVGIADYEDFIQTDAPINPGNSGGPLANMRGEIIGMNSAIATSGGQSAGVGFAIPTDMIKTMLPRLSRGEKIIRGQLGVIIQKVTSELARQFGLSKPEGALVAQVNEESPAEKAGIKPGDVIVSYNGKTISDTRSLRDMVAATQPGQKATIKLVRDGKQRTVTATIGRQETETAASEEPPSESQRSNLSKFGFNAQTLTPDMAQQLGAPAETGVLVMDVAPASPASLAGLQSGDVIVEANRKKVERVEQLRSILANADQQVLLLVKREAGSLFLVLPVK